MSFEEDLDELERRMEVDRQRLPLENAARDAQASGDLANAAPVASVSRSEPHRCGSSLQDAVMSRWYVEGNYLSEAHVTELNRIVSAYLDLAENRAQRGMLMKRPTGRPC